MNNYEYNNLSIVIPFRNEGEFISKLLNAINKQTFLPYEVIIVDSSTNEEVKGFVEEYGGIVPIVYHREKKAYPGKARNIGVSLAKGNCIGFLDSKTIPQEDWLERFLHLINVYHADVVFGVTKFAAVTPFQKILRAATYGKIGHHTLPGSLIYKKVYINSGEFLEHVRMGEDIEWRERLIMNGVVIHKPVDPVIFYTGLPDNLNSTFIKYLISAYHAARLNILRNVKDAYLSLFLILSAIVLPKWNHLVGGWDANPLFIPHVTKVYLIALVFLFLSYQLAHYLFLRNMSKTMYSKTLQLILLIFVSLAVFNWNAVIAGWMEDAVLYVPHITKMYVGVAVIASMIYRGIILPLNRNVEASYIFPFRWIKVGLLGLFIDLVKAPGYILGAILSFFRIFHPKVNNNKLNC